MHWLDALLLGVLEGLTEFLPVSSTGHLILLGELLGHQSETAKTLDVVIQLGAVLAVVVYYRERLWTLLRGALRREKESLKLIAALLVAFFPAALVGLAFHKIIKEKLFGGGPVGAALVVGGFVMMAVEWAKRDEKPKPDEGRGLADMTLGRAFVIGLLQCFSLWPGASRSMTTIVGGRIVGLGAKDAADFSFLLAIPTLGAATVFELVKDRGALFASTDLITSLAVGLVVSFVVALLVIAAFLRYLRRFGLAPFGVYRVVLGAVVLLLPFV